MLVNMLLIVFGTLNSITDWPRRERMPVVDTQRTTTGRPRSPAQPVLTCSAETQRINAPARIHQNVACRLVK
jgi:hypothetical protein